MQPASDPRLLARLARLELRARTAVEGLRGGRHRSRATGSSTTFSQHREYVPGDDLRKLDWKLVARSDKHIVREYEEESDLTVWIVVDASASMAFATGDWTKFEYATWLAAAIAKVAISQQDQAGLLLTRGEEVERALPARGGETHWRQLAEALAAAEPAGGGDPAPGLEAAAGMLDRKGIVVWIGDCLGDPEAAGRAAARLRHRGNDVLVLRTLDPAEVDFPFERFTRFEDLEGGLPLRADPRAVREAYLAEFEKHGADLRRRLRGLGCEFRRMPTDEPLEAGLVELLARRAARLRRSGA